MTSRARLLAVALGLLVIAPLATASIASAKSKAATRYYLALGDSLSVGYQPKANGVGVETNRQRVAEGQVIPRRRLALRRSDWGGGQRRDRQQAQRDCKQPCP